jgi:hypothetical protein
MIGMLMRDENRGERFRIVPGGAKTLEGLFAGKSRVDQKTSPLGRNQRGIAGARRRENRDLYDWVASRKLTITITFVALVEDSLVSCIADQRRARQVEQAVSPAAAL